MRKFCRTYLPFTTNQLKVNLAYKGAFYLYMLCSIFSSFINYYLWMAIYGSSGGRTLGGMTMHEMAVYVFMSYVASGVVMVGISKTVGKDVVKGNVAMNLIKPMDYRLSLIFRAMGDMLYHFLVPGIFVWVGIELYKVFVLGEALTPVCNIMLFVISVTMSFMIYVLFDFCFGMIAFFTTYIFGLEMAKSALLSFLTGQLIPLSFFPAVVQRVFGFLPFSSMIYTPVMIYLGKYTTRQILFAMGRQFVWIALLYLIGSLIWKQVTKRLIVLGG